MKPGITVGFILQYSCDAAMKDVKVTKMQMTERNQSLTHQIHSLNKKLFKTQEFELSLLLDIGSCEPKFA